MPPGGRPGGLCWSDTPGPEPLPVEQTPGAFDGPEVIDNTGISAVIHLAGGVSTMCNVAYGIDTTCGAIGIMPVIAGGVRDHSVTQRVLTPNITVHCRITLTEEQARVYPSENFTFITSTTELV